MTFITTTASPNREANGWHPATTAKPVLPERPGQDLLLTNTCPSTKPCTSATARYRTTRKKPFRPLRAGVRFHRKERRGAPGAGRAPQRRRQQLQNKPIVTGIIRTEKINQPGKLFVIIGRRTFSACQNLVNELDNYTNAIFVGEPTAGEHQLLRRQQPGGTAQQQNARLPLLCLVAGQAAMGKRRPGSPQIAADMSFDDYRSNRDPVLDAALNFSSDNFIKDPMVYLTELYMVANWMSYRLRLKRMVKDPVYRFFDFEKEFNDTGYRLMNRDQLEPALLVFQLNAQLFPESVNTWDSLAEAYWLNGKPDKAIEYYTKAIEMDPDGSTGENARKMLKRVKEGSRLLDG